MTKQLQDLVPDLSICQEAKEKGVEIESNYYWSKDEDNNDCLMQGTPSRFYKYYLAPLTDEILEKLPSDIVKNVDKKDSIFYLEIYKLDFFTVCYFNHEFGFKYRFEDKKLANALLRLAIKLKEEGII